MINSEFRLTPNLLLIRFWNGALGILLFIVLCYHLFRFTHYSIEILYLIYATVFGFFAIESIGKAVGLFNLTYPVLTIDNSGIATDGTLWRENVQWDEVESVKLGRKKILFELSGSIKSKQMDIPRQLRKFSPQLHSELSRRSREQGFEYRQLQS